MCAGGGWESGALPPFFLLFFVSFSLRHTSPVLSAFARGAHPARARRFFVIMKSKRAKGILSCVPAAGGRAERIGVSETAAAEEERELGEGSRR